MKRCESVEAYIEQLEQWQDEVERLREILQSTKLDETVKWGAPCYTFDGKNVVGIGAFKTYFGLWFHQGALLSDPLGVLINAQEGKTKAQRQWRMQSKKDIKARAIKDYVKEAINVQAEGTEIKPARNKPLLIPDELKQALSKDRSLKAAFEALTKGCQREYAEHIAEAKKETTRINRLEKIKPMILESKGLNDRYRK